MRNALLLELDETIIAASTVAIVAVRANVVSVAKAKCQKASSAF
jgi:hypothetical protein